MLPSQIKCSSDHAPKRRTRQRSLPFQDRPPAAVMRCQSADATHSAQPLRANRVQTTQRNPQSGPPPRHRLKNWFAPSTADSNHLPPSRKRSTVTPERQQNQPPAPLRSVLQQIQGLSLHSSSMESLFPGEHVSSTPQQHQGGTPAPSTALARAKIDDPSFYYLEVRLEHPLSLVDWHFHVTFTDLSTTHRASMEFDNLSVRNQRIGDDSTTHEKANVCIPIAGGPRKLPSVPHKGAEQRQLEILQPHHFICACRSAARCTLNSFSRLPDRGRSCVPPRQLSFTAIGSTFSCVPRIRSRVW